MLGSATCNDDTYDTATTAWTDPVYDVSAGAAAAAATSDPEYDVGTGVGASDPVYELGSAVSPTTNPVTDL